MDLEYFLYPLADELNKLDLKVPGVTVGDSTTTYTLYGYLISWPTDMPAGAKLLQMTGHGGKHPDRFWCFHGVWGGKHYYFPPTHPVSKVLLFALSGRRAPVRTAESIQASAAEVERSRELGMSSAAGTRLVQRSGVKGYSLSFAPSPAGRQKYPHLQNSWNLGPAAAPYDTMHLLLLSVVPFLWQLFSGQVLITGTADDYVLLPVDRTAIDKELERARDTASLSQARSLRNIDTRFRSYKAVDWLAFVLFLGEAVLVDRLPEPYFKMFMALCRACRLLFRPRGLTSDERTAVDADLRQFCSSFYTLVYRGELARVSLCRFTIAAALDIVPNIRSCGPVWVYWKFPMERYIGTLPRLMRSRSSPHAALTKAITRRYLAELISTFGEIYAPDEWASALGKSLVTVSKASSFPFPPRDNPDVTLTSPRDKPCFIVEPELTHMRTALAEDGVSTVPVEVYAEKYYRMRLSSGVLAGSSRSSCDEASGKRRSNLVRVQSHFWRRCANGSRERVLVEAYGIAHHYAWVYIGGEVRAFAYEEGVRSNADRQGHGGMPEVYHGMECFTVFGGRRRNVPVESVDAVVGTLYRVRDKRHIVLFNREKFSVEST